MGERSSERAALLPAEETAPSFRVGGDESDLLPLIDALSGDFTTPARPAIDWSASLTADWCAAEIAWQPAAGVYDQWLLVLPSDATGRAQWPELPASQAALTPTGAWLQPMTCSDWSTIDGYRDYLTRGPVGFFNYGGRLAPSRATTRVSTASAPGAWRRGLAGGRPARGEPLERRDGTDTPLALRGQRRSDEEKT